MYLNPGEKILRWYLEEEVNGFRLKVKLEKTQQVQPYGDYRTKTIVSKPTKQVAFYWKNKYTHAEAVAEAKKYKHTVTTILNGTNITEI